MIIENILAKFTPEVRDSDAMRMLVALCQTFSEQLQRTQKLESVRSAIWRLYKTLKETAQTQVGKEVVHQLYDDLISMKTDSLEINTVIANFSTYRDELLKALEHPGLPLHNNDSERDIRPVA